MLIVQVPAQTRRPERCPTLVRTELRGGVLTEREVEQVTLVPTVIQVAEETHQTGGVLITRGRAVLLVLRGETDVIQAFVRKALRHNGKLFRPALFGVPS